jgi:uncharacterized damage-inducible protein DinB
MTDPRYPIGRFHRPESITASDRSGWIDEIARVPAGLRDALAGLDANALDTPYRDGGWTVRQVAHHLPDSHLHAYANFKRALTEDEPAVDSYDEERWARLPDTAATPVEVSLALLDALHGRWARLLRALTETEFARGYVDRDSGRRLELGVALAVYAWHGRHHLGHVTALRRAKGW